MARKRMIAQAIWDDPDFSSLKPLEQLLFIGMITFADDYGHLPARAITLRKWIFGYQDDVTTDMVQGWLDHIIQQCRNIKVYTVDGQSYFEFVKWKQHQELKYVAKPLYPLPVSEEEQQEPAPVLPGSKELEQTIPGFGAILGNTGKNGENLPPGYIETRLNQDSIGKEKLGAQSAPAVPAAPAPQPSPPKRQRVARPPKSALADLYHQHMGSWPNATQEQEIVAAVTDPALFAKCLKAWRMRGFKPTNAEGVLEWYRHGGPPAPGGNGSGGARASPDGKTQNDRVIERFLARGEGEHEQPT